MYQQRMRIYIQIGTNVIFRFEFLRAGYGRHDFDQLTAWLDVDRDLNWANDSTEILINQKWYKGDTRIADDEFQAYLDEHGVVPNPDAVLSKYFYSEINIAEDYALGETWLRARVACSESINRAGAMTPYGIIDQGEVEDYMLNIVPEPATVSILSLGALAFVRRKK